MQAHTTPLNRKPEASPEILQATGLCFAYPERRLFSHWHASIGPGITLVRGGDGCGKTTLLRLLAGQLPADAGQLAIHGASLQDRPQAYRAQVFWAEPRSEAFDQLTPIAYFDLQGTAHPGFDAQRLARLVDGLALGPELHKQLYMLSTGSKRKVWLAAAFAAGAPLTLLDMPFAALDKASIAFVMTLLEELADHPTRACVLADYAAPGRVRLAQVMDLGD